MAGNITNVTAQGAGMPRRDVAYGYDMLDRLTRVSVYTNRQPPASSLSTWSYDLADNRTNATRNGVTTAYTLGIGDRLASTSDGATYLYSAAGCVTNISVPSVSSVVSLSWNSQYQLTAAYTNGVLAESYAYDALGRRVATTSGGITNYHVYDDNWQVLADLDASGQPLRTYTWAPGIDHLLAMTVYTETATNTYYAITDHLDTVHALVDAAGDIAESYEFDAWGNGTVYDDSRLPIPDSRLGNRYLFQGREYSYSTGLCHFRHRWYDFVTGRWLSNDPIGISGGLNQYVFCGNNPVNLTDPFGLCEDGDEVTRTYVDQLYRDRMMLLGWFVTFRWGSGQNWSTWEGRDIRGSHPGSRFKTRGRDMSASEQGNYTPAYAFTKVYGTPLAGAFISLAGEASFPGKKGDAWGSFKANAFGIFEAWKDLTRDTWKDFFSGNLGAAD